MAIFIDGMPCAICRKAMSLHDDRTSFPAFVHNPNDPLFQLSDCSLHTSCLKRSAIGLKTLAAAEEYFSRTGPGRRKCEVCGQEILHYEEYFGMGRLADSGTDFGAFNYVHLHKSHIGEWARASAFLRAANAVLNEGSWDGYGLKFMLAEVEAALTKAQE